MEAILEAQARDTFGKNEARRTRRGGQVPGVLYGGDGKGATPIAVPPKALLKILHSEAGQNTLISLKLAGAGDNRVLVKDFQLDPITHEVLHVDFFKIAMDKLLQVTIPIVVHGEPKGVKQQGGILEFIRREVVIEVLPADIPEHIDVDVTELMLHQGIRVRDIATSDKWKPMRARSDARPRDPAEGRGGRDARRNRGRGDGRRGRARSHQEGQEGRGRREGREEGQEITG